MSTETAPLVDPQARTIDYLRVSVTDRCNYRCSYCVPADGAARSAREASAKEVCMRCPVRAECATHALAVREPYGVWGGLTEDEREEMMGRSRHRLLTMQPTN